jgi:hypothetical protein
MKKSLDFKKIHKEQKIEKCCVGSFSFDPKGSHISDELLIKAIGGGGSWEDAPQLYKKGLSIITDE